VITSLFTPFKKLYSFWRRRFARLEAVTRVGLQAVRRGSIF